MSELVYVALSRSVAYALRAEVERLNHLVERCRTEGEAERYGAPQEPVEVADVAVLQVREALLRWPWCLRRMLPGELRTVHCVWSIDSTLRRVLAARAEASGLCLSDLLARMVHPQQPARARMAGDAPTRFHQPAWARLCDLERASARLPLDGP